MVQNDLSRLSFQSVIFIRKHLAKLLGSHRDKSERFCELIEEFIYNKDYTEYADWEDL